MKKLVLLAFIFSSFFQMTPIYAASEIQEQKIIQAELITWYITKHQKNIQRFIQQYEIKNNIELNSKLIELNNLIWLMNVIKNNQISDIWAQNNINVTLKSIKRINNELKYILQAEKDNYSKKLEKRKKTYWNAGKKLSQQLDRINIEIAKNIFKEKVNLTQREKAIKQHLLILDSLSDKLENIGNHNFNSEAEIKNNFILILKSIKKEMLHLKQTLKNK